MIFSIFCLVNNDKHKLTQFPDYTKEFLRKKHFYNIFNLLSKNNPQTQYHFYYSKEQLTDFFKILLEKGKYDFFIVGENTFLTELNDKNFCDSKIYPEKIKKNKEKLINIPDFTLDLGEGFTFYDYEKNYRNLFVDSFVLSRFPYPLSIFTTTKPLSIGHNSIFSDYIENPQSISSEQNPQFVVNEIRKFYKSFFLKYLANKSILNYIKKNKKNKKIFLVPLGLYLGKTNQLENRWLKMIEFFEKNIYPQIPQECDIIITCHQFMYQNLEGQEACKYLAKFAQEHSNIIYNQELFYCSANLSQWLIFYVDGIILTQDLSSLAYQALLHKKIVFSNLGICQKIFPKLSDLSKNEKLSPPNIDKVLYTMMKKYCHFRKDLHKADYIVKYFRDLKNKEATKIDDIHTDLDLLHKFTPYKYEICSITGKIKRKGYNYILYINFLLQAFNIKFKFFRRRLKSLFKK